MGHSALADVQRELLSISCHKSSGRICIGDEKGHGLLYKNVGHREMRRDGWRSYISGSHTHHPYKARPALEMVNVYQIWNIYGSDVMSDGKQ